jgi:hypothetical protein
MTEEMEISTPAKPEEKKIEIKHSGSSSDTFYAIGLIGAWVYYIGRASSFQEGVVGFFKAFGWPAVLVYKAFKLLERE